MNKFAHWIKTTACGLIGHDFTEWFEQTNIQQEGPLTLRQCVRCGQYECKDGK